MLTLSLPELMVGALGLSVIVRLLVAMTEGAQRRREDWVARNYRSYVLRPWSGEDDRSDRDSESAGVLVSAGVIFLGLVALVYFGSLQPAFIGG